MLFLHPITISELAQQYEHTGYHP